MCRMGNLLGIACSAYERGVFRWYRNGHVRVARFPPLSPFGV